MRTSTPAGLDHTAPNLHLMIHPCSGAGSGAGSETGAETGAGAAGLCGALRGSFSTTLTMKKQH